VVVAAGTNTVNFSEFLTSGNVGSNDLDTATDTAYRSGGGGGGMSTNLISCGVQMASAHNNLANGANTISMPTTVWDSGGIATNAVGGILIPHNGAWVVNAVYRAMDKDGDTRHSCNLLATGVSIGYAGENSVNQWTPTGTANRDYVSHHHTFHFVATSAGPGDYIQFQVNPIELDNEMDIDIAGMTAIYLGPVD